MQRCFYIRLRVFDEGHTVARSPYPEELPHMIPTRVIAFGAVFPAVFTAATASSLSLTGLHSLVQRRIPQHADKFQFNVIDGTGDSFTISDSTTEPGAVIVDCTTLSACARGLYTYALPVPHEI